MATKKKTKTKAKPRSKTKKPPTTPDFLDVAEERGWTFEWKQEEGDWNDYLGEGDSIDDIEEVLYVLLKDKTGRVLQSTGGITFAKSTPVREAQEYGRSIERDLVSEALHDEQHGR